MSKTLHEASKVKKREQLMAHYGWVYEDNAEKRRDFKIFQDHVELIESFKTALNRFRDLTNAEFRASHNVY
ncbi:hypothetical protein ACSBR2_042414 [Camellia fascicularis]